MSPQLSDRDLDLLENAYAAEINTALSGNEHLFRSKSKRAENLVDEGMLVKTQVVGGRKPRIYFTLTDLGRLTYCTSERCKTWGGGE